MRWGRSGRAAPPARTRPSRAATGGDATRGERGLRSIAFPAISTGVYRFPLERATRIAVAEVARALEGGTSVEKAIFCCFSAADRAVYERVLDERES